MCQHSFDHTRCCLELFALSLFLLFKCLSIDIEDCLFSFLFFHFIFILPSYLSFPHKHKQELKEAFESEAKEKSLPRLLLTVAVSAGAETVKGGYDVAAVGKHVDFISIMSYDFHGKWEPKTGHNAPLFALSAESEWRKMLTLVSTQMFCFLT